jgi:hypothetical protein
MNACADSIAPALILARVRMSRMLLVVLLMTFSCAANAQRTWVCSYPGGKLKEPQTLKYVKAGEYLVESHFGLRYRILQDSKHALVAAWSIAETESNPKEASIGVFTVMIDKNSKRYRRSVASLGDGQETVDVGKCESQ